MKIKLLLASSLAISLASINVASAQEAEQSSSRHHPGPEVYEIKKCGQILWKKNATYVLKKDLVCGAHEVAEDLPQSANFGHLGVIPAVLVWGNNITVDLNGHSLAASHGPLDSQKAVGFPGFHFNTGVLLAGKGGKLINSSNHSQSKVKYFDNGVVVTGDKNLVDDLKVEQGEVGFWVLSDENTFTNTIAEDNEDYGYLVGYPEHLSEVQVNNHHPADLRDNSFLYNAAVRNGEGFVVTSQVLDHLIGGFNVFAFNIVEGDNVTQHGIYLNESTGNFLFNNSISNTQVAAIQIELEDQCGCVTNADGITNFALSNFTFGNEGAGFELENSHGAILVANFSTENDGLDFSDNNGYCANNIYDIHEKNLYVANHAELGNVNPSCTLNTSGYPYALELAEEFKALIK